MKKLFTLVLALVMVFAIAAPAMAAWNAPAATTGAPYSIKVTAVQENKDAYGHIYYTAFPANGAVVAGTPVKVMIEAKIPTLTKLEAQYGVQNFPVTAFSLALDLTNLTIRDIAETLKIGNGTANPVTFLDADGEYLGGLVPGADALVYTAIVNCTVDETKAAKFEATLGYMAAEKFATGTDVAIDANFKINLVPGTSATIKYVKGSTNYTLTLALGSDNKVTGWKLGNYTVLGNAFVDATATPAIVAVGDDGYADLAAALKIFTDKLGFVYGDTVYFTAANVLANFGFSGEVSDFCTFQPYTSSLTVSDTAAVPNTGDSVSVIGFVMVGLALLATAAVVVKKVRA